MRSADAISELSWKLMRGSPGALVSRVVSSNGEAGEGDLPVDLRGGGWRWRGGRPGGREGE